MPQTKYISTSRILDTVCKVTWIQRELVVGKCRKNEIVTARHLYSYFCCKYRLQSTAHILINQDHSTVIHGRNNITAFLESKGEELIKMYVADIDKRLSTFAPVSYFCHINNVCRYQLFKFEIKFDEHNQIIPFINP